MTAPYHNWPENCHQVKRHSSSRELLDSGRRHPTYVTTLAHTARAKVGSWPYPPHTHINMHLHFRTSKFLYCKLSFSPRGITRRHRWTQRCAAAAAVSAGGVCRPGKLRELCTHLHGTAVNNWLSRSKQLLTWRQQPSVSVSLRSIIALQSAGH